MSARPYHIPWYAHQIIPYSIPCLPGHTIYHMRCPPGLTIYHAMSTMPYRILCHARQTMTCPLGHTIYHAMHCQTMPYTMLCIARPYPIPCYARQGIPYTMSCPPGHTIYHAMPARLYHIPCHASSGHTIYYAMPARPYLFPCHVQQAIPYTMPCLSGHTTYEPGQEKTCFCNMRAAKAQISLRIRTV